MLQSKVDPGKPPEKNYLKMVHNSNKDRAKGNLSGGYSGGANHPPAAKKGKRRMRHA